MASMHAMVLDAPRKPLVMRERPVPVAGAGEILVAVAACGVCRTDLHVVDGELEHPKLPIVPGHEIVGRVAATGAGVSGFAIGERVGVPWLGATCGTCPYCRSGARKSVRYAGVHRLHPRRRLCDPCARRCAVLLSAWRGGRRRRDRALAVRRADRLAQLPHGRRGQDARPLRLRRRRPYPGAGRDLAGAARVRLHAQGRQCRAGLRALARRGVGGRLGTRRRRNRSMPPSSSRRSARWCRPR